MHDQPLRVSFADLTHTGQVIASNTFPLGVSLVAAFARENARTPLAVEVFKYPDDFAAYLDRVIPDIACFSNFSWNMQLSTGYAAAIKRRAPQTIAVFGGPNYPLTAGEQTDFLKAYPQIDFYVWLEGEGAFVRLVDALADCDFSAEKLKASGQLIPGVHYIDPAGKLVAGPLGPRLNDLTRIPSPYCSGLNDKFFDDILIPMIQTNRGCPYQCTFCTEGQDYYNKIHWSARERIDDDLKYIAERVRVPDLIIVDSNFGMFKEDLETCRTLAELQETRHWPKHIHVSAGKNRKERVLEAAATVKGAINLSATIQSIDEHVLELVKRRNISVDQIVDVGKQAEALGANSYSEIILCLPGDTLTSHYRSVFTMMDVGINFLRMYQLMMLPGSDLSSQATRQRFGMQTRYRVLPRCFGSYKVFGNDRAFWEIEEICIGNSTMPYGDYLDCRELNLTAELFYNSGSFRELLNFLSLKGIKPSALIGAVHAARRAGTPELTALYAGFRDETHSSLWDSRADLEAFIATPGTVDRYISGELGNNELFKYRAQGFFHTQEALHRILFTAARQQMEPMATTTALELDYLAQLERYSLLKKSALLAVDETLSDNFSFDFMALEKAGFHDHPALHHLARSQALQFDHSAEQCELIASYVKQYGTTLNGLGRILLRSHVNKLHRQARTC